MAIIVVDSDRQQQARIKEMLAGGGYQHVSCYTTREELMKVLAIDQQGANFLYPDVELILLNNIAQAKDFDLVGIIRENIQYRDVPIVITSESREPEFIQMGFAFGANDFIAQPIQSVELIARVRSCMRLKHEVDRRRAREKELIEVSKQLSDLNSWLVRLSLVDSLTKVANRRAFDDNLTQEWKRGIRNKSPIGVLMIDVDYFKQYNDTAGHQAGDNCLVQIASGIQKVLSRPADQLCRYGGDEFTILLPDTDLEGVKFVGDKIKLHIDSMQIPHPCSTIKHCVTVSIGGSATMPTLTGVMTDVVESADEGLYESKEKGRNCVSVVECAPQAEKKAA
ncbi:MAG: diguanylate cyclase domain-containing protein [Bdellovibrionota bacterium]